MRSALVVRTYAFLRDTVTSRYTVTLFRLRTATRFKKPGVVDVQVSNRLVDPDQPDLLADDRDLEYLVRQNHLRVVPSACRRAYFAALDALKMQHDLVGLQKDFARFHA